jgi:hypothetical protein
MLLEWLNVSQYAFELDLSDATNQLLAFSRKES